MRCGKGILVVISITILVYTGSGSTGVLGGAIFENKSSLPRCPITNPIEIGRIQEPELVEASGMVASRHHPGIYYSIQDSKNPDNVYALKYNGDTLGKFDLEGVDQNDWEDITMLEYNGIDYIYVSDTGNNWDGHCRGTDNYEDMRVYRFPEPDLSRFRNGVATIPASDITTMILKNPNQPTDCEDRTKQDFECLMADQTSGDVYLVQKNVFGTNVSLYKFRPTASSETITLKEVGKIVSKKSSLSGPTYPWPMGITAGDISRNGRLILIRNYPVLRMWERMENQSVEDAILNNEPCELPLKDEPLGESIAIRDDDTGFVTTSDGQSHAPIYLYEFY